MSMLNHAKLLALSKRLKRPLYTLEVTRQDPFTAGAPARLAAAEWFAGLWERFSIQPGAHLRRVHYLLVSQSGSVTMPDGSPYLNLDYPCYDLLNKASLDARYLGLVPATDLVDRRNAEPIIYLPEDVADFALIAPKGGLLDSEPPRFLIPRLSVTPPIIPQPYHVELWCEKSTMNDVLMPLGVRYGVNVITGSGELSFTACVNVVERAEQSGRPVRILYISDFDPAGASMPVAVARKIEYRLYQEALHDLDIQVRPIVLTHDQCIHYRLPRTPIKASETRAAGFEARFGEGATELDALEALHPGELAQILRREIGRYHEDNLDGRIAETAEAVQGELNAINDAVRERHAKAIAELEAEHAKVLAAIASFKKKVRPVLLKIEKDLEAEAPEADDFEWPEPEDGDEDPDPLFDSTRDYLDQVDRYKAHQGKPTESIRKAYDFFPTTCAVCGKAFEATSRNVLRACSGACREKLRRQKMAPPPIPCVICGAPFKSIRGAETCSDSCRNKLKARRARGAEKGLACRERGQQRRVERPRDDHTNRRNNMHQYLDLMQRVLDEGVEKRDRTGTGTLSVFGHQMRFDLARGFPLLTTKQVHFKSIAYELLWFLAGDTNIKYLTDHGVHIWDEWADERGDLSPVYGRQWRSWPARDGGTIDQIGRVIADLRHNPDSRRLIVTAWNPADVERNGLAALPLSVPILCRQRNSVLPAVSALGGCVHWGAIQRRILRAAHHDAGAGDRLSAG